MGQGEMKFGALLGIDRMGDSSYFQSVSEIQPWSFPVRRVRDVKFQLPKKPYGNDNGICQQAWASLSCSIPNHHCVLRVSFIWS